MQDYAHLVEAYRAKGGQTTVCKPKNLGSKQLRRGWWKPKKEEGR